MTHRQKLKMARKMLTNQERKFHLPPFASKGWIDRKLARASRHRSRNVPKEIKNICLTQSKISSSEE